MSQKLVNQYQAVRGLTSHLIEGLSAEDIVVVWKKKLEVTKVN
jgi:hypothetical protein